MHLSLTYFLRHGQALRVDNGRQFLLLELLDGVLVVPQVEFGAHQNDGGVGAVVSHLRVPLVRKHKWTVSWVSKTTDARWKDIGMRKEEAGLSPWRGHFQKKRG